MARDACTTLDLVNVLQGVSHVLGPRAILARPMPSRDEGTSESNAKGFKQQKGTWV